MLWYLVPLVLSTISTAVALTYYVGNVWLSHRHRTGPGRAPAGSPSEITVVVPVYAEPRNVFQACVDSLARQGSPFVVVGDGCEEPYRQITESRGGRFVALATRQGKKRAMARGLREVRTPLVAFVDSDTRVPPGGLVRLSTHLGPRIGGVGANLTNRMDGGTACHGAEFVERSRELVFRAMSSRGSVLNLDGACSLFRTELIRPYMSSPDFLETRVWGRPTRLGDDWLLTDHLLRQGFRVVKAYDVTVEVEPPPSWGALAHQNVRWMRSQWIRLGRLLRRGTGPGYGPLEKAELAGMYALPLVALATLAWRLSLTGHILSRWWLRSIRTWGPTLRHGLSLHPLPWPFMFVTLEGYLTVGAAAAFAGLVLWRMREHRGRRLAFGALAVLILFGASIYGLLTFWKAPLWREGQGARIPSTAPRARSALDL
jgi:cellulose synthase/poly-beta-1,6-N-acetylglucosamine synthase-like glycosyltransferase